VDFAIGFAQNYTGRLHNFRPQPERSAIPASAQNTSGQ
jgi:hypothetical protein